MSAESAVLGIDGCPGGWVGALVSGSSLSWHAGSLASLLALDAAVVAVDIPLALPLGGTRRRCEVEARSRLGAQRSSVFFAPPTAVLAASTHAEASVLSRGAGSVGVSIQTWNIVPKIAEALACSDQRLVEVHPELSFRALGPITASKRSPAGQAERLALLQSWLPAACVPVPRPGGASPDDCLDALAAAWTASRHLAGTAQELGHEVLDGRISRIVV
jgi:predicted RNase H-like nuclease